MNIAVFCGSSSPKSEKYTTAARQLGQLIALGGHTLLYGGSNLGLMGTVSSASLEGGGHVVGVIPSFFSEEVILSQPVSELVRVASMAERKEYLIAHSDAFIALPGGIGTLDEVFEVLVANQLGRCSKPMGLLNTQGFFNPQMEMLRHMESEGLYNLTDARYLIIDDQPEGLLQMLTSFVPLPIDGPVARRLRTDA
ncbi:MAG: TIGR00730 family Rossman fold protein [Bacteroidales bacterium]|nr:TIGR00730 family Rossman fold protein [Bacteroidales bacterium]